MTQKVPCRSCHADILPETAARTGGICMRCQREGPPTPSRIVQLSRRTPARCLKDFRVTQASVLEHEAWETIETAVFSLGCECGNVNLKILGHYAINEAAPGETIFIAPLSLHCDSCSKVTPLFDPRQDGYDGEIDSSAGMTGEGKPIEFPCPRCNSQVFEPVVQLSYSLDDEDWDELEGRPQDFFTWFMLEAKCGSCGSSCEVTGYECA